MPRCNFSALEANGVRDLLPRARRVIPNWATSRSVIRSALLPADKTINSPLDPWVASMCFKSRLKVTHDPGARQVGTIIFLLVLGLEASASMFCGDSRSDT